MSKVLSCLLFGLLAIPCAVLTVGCEDDDNDGDTTIIVTNAPAPAPAQNAMVAGNWNGTRADSGGSTGFQLHLDQNNDVLQGAYDDGGWSGNLTGSIDGQGIALTIIIAAGPGGADVGEVWNVNGSVNAAANGISATVNYSSGGSSSFNASR